MLLWKGFLFPNNNCRSNQIFRDWFYHRNCCDWRSKESNDGYWECWKYDGNFAKLRRITSEEYRSSAVKIGNLVQQQIFYAKYFANFKWKRVGTGNVYIFKYYNSILLCYNFYKLQFSDMFALAENEWHTRYTLSATAIIIAPTLYKMIEKLWRFGSKCH